MPQSSSPPQLRAASFAKGGQGARRLRSNLLTYTTALIFTLVGATAALAQDAHTLAQKIDRHYNHLPSLQTAFTEHYQGMGMDRTESGTLLMKKPGRMRWSYNSADGQPTGKLFVLDGKSAYFYTPGDTQAQRTPARQLDDMRSPLRLLLGHTQLEKELDNLTLALAADGFRLSGTPRGMQQKVQSITLDVTAEGIIQAIRIQEADGAITEFHFTGMRENVPVKDADFIFMPPPGVALVDGLPPM